MIHEIRRKFIFLSMVSLLLLLAIIVTGINLVNYRTMIFNADSMLRFLSQHEGNFPNFKPGDYPKFVGPETPYEARMFVILLDQDGKNVNTDVSRIKAVDKDSALQYAHFVFNSGKTRGFVEQYRFLCSKEGELSRIIFLDCRRDLVAIWYFLFSSIAMATIGYLLFFLVILFFSGRITRPVSESYEKQKRFITDAGHEIKTPLSIIQADLDVLALDMAENEWVTDMQKQVQRLSALTEDLVNLSRMEEAGQMPMIDFPFSDIVEESVSSFQTMAQIQGKQLSCQTQPLLSLKGNEKAIRQLLHILLDNALKYTPEAGEIRVKAEKKSRGVSLQICNTSSYLISQEQLSLIFDRFYRADSSRNSGTAGYGIGLSVARAIVNAHRGKITANSPDGHSMEIIVYLP